MLWYQILGIYLGIVFGLIILIVVQARNLSPQAYRRRADGKHSRWVQVWRWIRFIARCGRRRKRKAKPVVDRREERRALRKRLREEAEEWLSECIERIVELGEDLLDGDFDDEDECEDDYLAGEEQGSGEEVSDEASGDEQEAHDTRQVVYGLVNTGNSCFFNSVLQALASAEYLQNYLSSVLERMDEANDVYGPTLLSMPLTEALWETLTDLNAVVNRDSAFQPYAVMAALGSSRLNDREQQDAQEAFQLISTALSDERQVFAQLQVPSLLNADLANMLRQVDERKSHVLAVPRGLESVGTKGLARVKAIMRLTNLAGSSADGQSLTFGRHNVLQNPFTGLMASRLSCAQCGYTEAVRHFAFDNVSLTLPLVATYTLDQALREYISLEELSGVQCRKCTLHKTLNDLVAEIKAASSWLAKNPRYNVEQEENTRLAYDPPLCKKARRQAARAEALWRRAVLNEPEPNQFSDSDDDDDASLKALWETLTDLNAVVNRDSAFQPYAVMAALGSSRLNDREQQDAQEAFQLISTALSDERQVFAQLQVPSLLNADLANMLRQVDERKSHVLAVPRGLESVGTKGLARVKAIMRLTNLAGSSADGQSLTFGRHNVLQNPFTGLMASRLSCAQCGYTEAVRHFAFDNVSLTLPLVATYTLDQALREYISLEELSGVQCRKCTLHKTLNDLVAEIKAASSWLAKNPRYNVEQEENTRLAYDPPLCKKARRQAARAEALWRRAVLNEPEPNQFSDSDDDDDASLSIDSNDDDNDRGRGSACTPGLAESEYPINPAKQQIDRTHNLPPPYMINVPRIIDKLKADAGEVARALRTDIQSTLPGISLHKAYSPLSTKQVAFAKLPPCLCLHLSRSAITPEGYIVKNPCHVRFPEFLDFSPYTTNGHLKVDPTKSMIDQLLTPSVTDVISSLHSVYGSSSQQRLPRDIVDALGHGVSPQTGYRLQAVVVHIGSHSYGHFITYRRKPRPPIWSGINTPRHHASGSTVSLSQHMPVPLSASTNYNTDKRALSAAPQLPSDGSGSGDIADGIRKRKIVGGSSSNGTSSNGTSENAGFGDAFAVDDFSPAAHSAARPKRSWRVTDAMTAEWYLISDEDVQAVTLAEVLSANPYLLIYERVDSAQLGEYAGTPSILPSLTNLRNLARR
ncbi:ubiquitin-specific protease ubp1, partial [Dipsacomyces acuminosporus]